MFIAGPSGVWRIVAAAFGRGLSGARERRNRAVGFNRVMVLNGEAPDRAGPELAPARAINGWSARLGRLSGARRRTTAMQVSNASTTPAWLQQLQQDLGQVDSMFSGQAAATSATSAAG